jgi:hypothetical protein
MLRAEKGHFAFNAYMLSLATTSSPATCASMFNYLPGLNYSIILHSEKPCTIEACFSQEFLVQS